MTFDEVFNELKAHPTRRYISKFPMRQRAYVEKGTDLIKFSFEGVESAISSISLTRQWVRDRQWTGWRDAIKWWKEGYIVACIVPVDTDTYKTFYFQPGEALISMCGVPVNFNMMERGTWYIVEDLEDDA